MPFQANELYEIQDHIFEGLTYQVYFALQEASQDALWERIFAEDDERKGL